MGQNSKLLTATKDMQMAYESHRANIFDTTNPGEICSKLCSLLHINIYIFENAKFLGAENSNISAIYPSSRNRCIPMVHWTEVRSRFFKVDPSSPPKLLGRFE